MQTGVMISKGGGTYFLGIGLVEVLWKAIYGIIDIRLSYYIQFHDVLHGFRWGRGTCISALESKLLQQIIAMRETVIHAIFLYLCNAYDAPYRERCLDILAIYGVGYDTIHILWTYWARIQMAVKVGGHYRPTFQIHHGGTQGDPLTPTIFNIFFDAVI